MGLFLFGAGKCALDILTGMWGQIDCHDIKGVIDTAKTGSLAGKEIVTLEQVPRSASIIISVYNEYPMVEIYEYCYSSGYHNLYYYNPCSRPYAEKDSRILDLCDDISGWEPPILPHLEMHVSDKCNLNCKGCTHFSPLFSDLGANAEEQIKYLKKLKEKGIRSIGKLWLLGGEPLLQSDLIKIIKNARELYPETILGIVTNGLLLPTASEELLLCMRDYNVNVDISEYEPTMKIEDAIVERLEAFHVKYEIRPRVIKFNLPLSLSENSTHKRRCISDGCVTLWNGKIARCPTLMYIDRFNEYFGTSLPNDGILDLEEVKGVGGLASEMKKEVPLCRHCVENLVEWGQCGAIRKLEDFAVLN